MNRGIMKIALEQELAYFCKKLNWDTWMEDCARDVNCSSWGGGSIDVQTGEHTSVHMTRKRKFNEKKI